MTVARHARNVGRRDRRRGGARTSWPRSRRPIRRCMVDAALASHPAAADRRAARRARACTSSPRSSARRRRPVGSRATGRTSSRGPAPTRPAAPRPSRCCASRTGSAGRSTTCGRCGPRSPSRSWPRTSSSRTSSCRCCGPPAPTWCCCWPCSTTRDALARLVERALELGLEPLVEAHDERELDAALATGARLIGLNNRDLRTLEVDVERASRLRASVPDDRLVIAESGVRDAATVARWRALGLRWRARRRGARARGGSGRRRPRVRARPAPLRTIRPTSRAGRSSRSAASPTRGRRWPRSPPAPTPSG